MSTEVSLHEQPMPPVPDYLTSTYVKDMVSVANERQTRRCTVGYIDGQHTYEMFMLDLKASGVAFAVRTSNKNKCSLKPQFECSTSVRIPFFGSPFLSKGTVYFECVFGKNYHQSPPVENVGAEINRAYTLGKRPRPLNHPSKKLGCPATLNVKEIAIFTEDKYKLVSSENWRKKKQILDNLCTQLRDGGNPPATTTRFFIRFFEEHNHPVTHQGMDIHPDLVQSIRNLVDHGFTTVGDVKNQLKEQVARMFEDKATKPNQLNTAFFPSDAVIYAHMYRELFARKEKAFETEGSPAKRRTVCARPVKRLQQQLRQKLKLAMHMTYNCMAGSALRDAISAMENVAKFLQPPSDSYLDVDQV